MRNEIDTSHISVCIIPPRRITSVTPLAYTQHYQPKLRKSTHTPMHHRLSPLSKSHLLNPPINSLNCRLANLLIIPPNNPRKSSSHTRCLSPCDSSLSASPYSTYTRARIHVSRKSELQQAQDPGADTRRAKVSHISHGTRAQM